MQDLLYRKNIFQKQLLNPLAATAFFKVLIFSANGFFERLVLFAIGHYYGHCEKSPYLSHGHYNGHNVHFSLLCFSKV